MRGLELNGAYRYVDNSVSGSENVWDVARVWTVIDGVTLRGFDEPKLPRAEPLQLFDPSSTSLQALGTDPCDSRSIASGPNGSANRMANCQAEFAAHPGYGSLASFQDVAQNFSTAAVTTEGNSSLRNEVSRVWTYGGVLQPDFIPGLSFTLDRIEIKLTNALSQVAPSDILTACYDSTPAAFGANPLCNGAGWTRDSTGQIVAAKSTFLNAAYFQYKGETYNLAYTFAVNDLFHESTDFGRIDLNLQATYTELNNTSVLGNAVTQLAGTAETSADSFGDPRWVTRFDVGYTLDKLRVSYELYYLPSSLVTRTANITNTPFPTVKANAEHSISAQYALTDNVTLRGGITNFTDEKPSFPLLEYGDVIGRRFFVGANVHF